MVTTKEFPTLTFPSAAAFAEWLSEHHTQSDGIWLQIAKKATGIATVTYDEALDIALCHGWIDGQRNSHDDSYFQQKFTPRRRKSLWSQRNIEKVAQLTAEGKMKPAGLAEVEAAQQDGRWEAAYASPKNMVFPEDFQAALEANETAKAFFDTLNKTNVYAIAWRLETAKTPETRKRRFDSLMAMLERGEKIHS